MNKTNPKASLWLDFGPYYRVEKKIKPTQNSQAMKKGASVNSLGKENCEIKGSVQDMAAMMLMLINFNYNVCALLTFIIIIIFNTLQ